MSAAAMPANITPMATPEKTALCVQTLLKVTSEELSRLASKSITLEHSLSEMVGADADAATLSELQDLDYLSQSLEALSSLWATLAKETPQDWSYQNSNAADAVLLRDLGAKLKGAAPATNVQDLSGDCDFF